MDINEVLDTITCSDNESDWNESENEDSGDEEEEDFVSPDPLATEKVNFHCIISSISSLTSI